MSSFTQNKTNDELMNEFSIELQTTVKSIHNFKSSKNPSGSDGIIYQQINLSINNKFGHVYKILQQQQETIKQNQKTIEEQKEHIERLLTWVEEKEQQYDMLENDNDYKYDDSEVVVSIMAPRLRGNLEGSDNKYIDYANFKLCDEYCGEKEGFVYLTAESGPHGSGYYAINK